MALAPLAAVADLRARGVDTTDTLRIDTALDVASSAVRTAAETAISRCTSTLQIRAVQATYLPLPGPIWSVDTVTIGGAPATGYEIDDDRTGLHLRRGWAGGKIVVTFDHGLPEVPADIVDLTCTLAIAWLGHIAEGGGSTAGLSSVRVDDANESYTDEAAGQVSPVFIPEATRSWLANRFGGGAYVVSSRGHR